MVPSSPPKAASFLEPFTSWHGDMWRDMVYWQQTRLCISGSNGIPWNSHVMLTTGPLQWHCEVLLASVVTVDDMTTVQRIREKHLYKNWGQGAAPHTFAKCPWAFHSPQDKCSWQPFCCFKKKVENIPRCPCRFLCVDCLRIAHIAKGQSAHRAKTLPWSGFKGKGSKSSKCSGYSPKSHVQGEDV